MTSPDNIDNRHLKPTQDPVEPHLRNPRLSNPCAPQLEMQPLILGSPFRLLPTDPNESNHMVNFIRAALKQWDQFTKSIQRTETNNGNGKCTEKGTIRF